MKKLICLLLICALVACMVACKGETPEPDITESTSDTTETTVDTTEDSTEEEEPEWTLTLNQKMITLVNKGDTFALYDGTAPVADVTWGSDDTAVATFKDGVATAVGKGSTVVWAEYQGVRVTCTVTCNIKQTNTSTGTTTPSGNTGSTTTTGSREPVLAAPTTQTVDSSFFDDAVFIGDSISLKLSYYAASSGELGNAKFLVVGSYSVCNAIDDGLSLTYQGVTYKNVEEALAATGASKVFIMLGMNDIARGDYGYVDGAIKNWGKLVDMLRSTCPDITIYIQSMTPVWTGGERGRLSNTYVDDYNAKLEVFAANNGCKFINVAPYMKDSTGGLATKFCSDNYVHLTNDGARTWIQVLKAYTGY